MKKTVKKLFARKTGSTLIELILAVGVVALVMTTLVSVMGSALRATAQARAKNLAGEYSQEGVEFFRRERQQLGWESFVDVLKNDGAIVGGAAITYCLPTLPASDTEFVALTNSPCGASQYVDTKNIFKRYAQVKLSQAGTKTEAEVKVMVDWQDGSRQSQAVSVQDFSDINSVLQSNVITLPNLTTPSPTPTAVPSTSPTASPNSTPNPTPTSTPCPVPAAPTQIQPQGIMPFSNVPEEITWNPAQGATSYKLEVDDKANGFNTSCTPIFQYDVCQTVNPPNYQYFFRTGHFYSISVQANNACGSSAKSTVTFQVQSDSGLGVEF